MSIVFLCSECHEETSANEDLAGLKIRCPHCFSRVRVPREERRPRPDGKALPWLPGQAFAASFLFGPLAGGVVTGINFSRMGKRFALLPCTLLGIVLFALFLALLARVPDLPRPAAMLISLAIGGLFLLLQRSPFTAWLQENGLSSTTNGAYKPGGMGRLLLIGFGCFLVEVGVIVAIVYCNLV